MNFFKFNGVVLMVADKKETSSARDKVTVPRNTPLELFGEKGLNYIEVRTGVLSKWIKRVFSKKRGLIKDEKGS